MGRHSRLTLAVRCSECGKAYYDEQYKGEPCRNEECEAIL